jgi:hypothetical protein
VKLLIAASLIFLSSVSGASTFVGNGGNVGDVELQMTLQQLSETFSIIANNEDEAQKDLCVCTRTYEGRPLCDVLKRLTAPQVKFCSRYVQLKASELALTLKKKDRIQFTWTDEPIQVREGIPSERAGEKDDREEGRLRSVDAVTNIKDMSMTLNQKSFLQMTPDERTFLVGHEMFHLTSYQGAPLSDEGAIGPFGGSDGSRQFINAMAATLVMTANEFGLFRLSEETLLRSKASKKFWLNLGYDSFSPGLRHDNVFAVESLKGSELGGRYQFDTHWGAVLDYRDLSGERNRMTQIQGKEARQILSLGVSYRWFPQDNPLTFWGQSHAVFALTMDRVNTTYDLTSAHTALKDTAATTGYSLSAKYYFPFRGGFWWYGGLTYSDENVFLPQIEIDYSGGPAATLGVSYGF